MFSAYLTGFLRVRKVRKILGVFEVFLGVFEKTKEKKDREALLAKALLPPSRIYPESRNSGKEKAHKLSGASFRRGDFAPREPEFDPKFGDANF